MGRFVRSLASLVCVSPIAAIAAQAQQVPTREQVKPPVEPEASAPASAARVDERGAFAAGPCPLTRSAVKVTIQRVEFAAPGGGPLPSVIAQALTGIAPPEGVQPIAAVCQLRDEANARLRAARYVASVQIPAQRIEDGVLRLEVVTGRITQVRVRGDAGPFEATIRSRIARLSTLDPLNAADAEAMLVSANDVPGLNVQLALSPSTGGKPGDLVGELTISYRRFTVIGNVQNYNSHLLGRETAYLRAEAYGLLGLDDQTTIAGATTFDFKKQKVLQVSESIGLSENGDRLSLTGTIAWSRPALESLDLRTTSLIGALEFTHPLVRTVTSKSAIAAGFEYSVQRTKVFGNGGSVPFNRDRIATIYARIDGETRKLRLDGTAKWSVGGSLEVRKGLDILGATETGKFVDGFAPSRFSASATATVLRTQLSGTYAIGPVLELASTLRGQYSNRQLLNYDLFSIGNLTVGRGYDPGANTGDRAIGGAHEIRVKVAPLPRDITAQAYVFYDWVQLYNLDPSSTERSRFLRSTGGGLRIGLFNAVRLDLTYARPLDPPLLTGTNIKRPTDRFMFSLVSQLYPFGARR